MSIIGIVLIVILFLVLFGGVSGLGGVPYGYGGGHYGMGGIGLILIIIVVLVFLGRL